MLLSLATFHFILSSLQRNSLVPSPSPPDTHRSLSALLPPLVSQTDTSTFQYSARSSPHTELSLRCTFVSPWTRGKQSGEHDSCTKGWGLSHQSSVPGRGKKPSFKRRKICLPVPQALKDCPFPALTAGEGPARWWSTTLTMRFSFSHHCDTRGRGSSLGRTPHIRDVIHQCALPNASPLTEAQQRGLHEESSITGLLCTSSNLGHRGTWEAVTI